MKCNCCGFLVKGKELICPHCGDFMKPPYLLEKRVNIFNWFTLSVHSLSVIVGLNLFLVSLILEILLKNTLDNFTYHFYPYVFLGAFLILYLFNNFILKAHFRKVLFLKFLLIFASFCALLLLSYNPVEFILPNIATYQLIFGYLVPLFCIFVLIFGIIYYIAKKKFDIFGIIINCSIILVISILDFVFSKIQFGSFSIIANSISKFICEFSFGITLLITFNALVFCVLRLKTRTNKE